MEYPTYYGLNLAISSFISINGQNQQLYWARLHFAPFWCYKFQAKSETLLHVLGASNLQSSLSESTDPVCFQLSNIPTTDLLNILKAPVSLSTSEQPPTSSEFSCSTSQSYNMLLHFISISWLILIIIDWIDKEHYNKYSSINSNNLKLLPLVWKQFYDCIFIFG